MFSINNVSTNEQHFHKFSTWDDVGVRWSLEWKYRLATAKILMSTVAVPWYLVILRRHKIFKTWSDLHKSSVDLPQTLWQGWFSPVISSLFCADTKLFQIGRFPWKKVGRKQESKLGPSSPDHHHYHWSGVVVLWFERPGAQRPIEKS